MCLQATYLHAGHAQTVQQTSDTAHSALQQACRSCNEAHDKCQRSEAKKSQTIFGSAIKSNKALCSQPYASVAVAADIPTDLVLYTIIANTTLGSWPGRSRCGKEEEDDFQ